ncbi:MAG: VOC family protein [Patescibacteria group bacterium]|nr:VOC family protein [Patescibacteria group bacterium]
MRFNKLIPELYVSDFEKSLKFYVGLGFKIEYQREPLKFAFLSYQESQLMIQEIEPEWLTGKLEYPYGRGINLQINTNNIYSIEKSLKKNHYPINNIIEENSYQKEDKLLICKELRVMDPDGYLLRFSQDIKEESLN